MTLPLPRFGTVLLLALTLLVTACGEGDLLVSSDGDVTVLAESEGDLSTTRTLVAPDIKVTAHIRRFDVDTYMDELDDHPAISHNFFRRIAMRVALGFVNDSANPEPTYVFNPQWESWEKFKASGEYRGYVHLSNHRITCTNGVLTTRSTPTVESSPGYTPEGNGYTLGSSFNGSAAFPIGAVTQVNAANTCVKLIDRRASRMSDSLRSQHKLAFGFDAPFIWTVVSDELCCDGTNKLRVESSAFPTHRVYVNEKLVQATAQSGWANFVAAGGKDSHATGEGNLAPAGAPYTR